MADMDDEMEKVREEIEQLKKAKLLKKLREEKEMMEKEIKGTSPLGKVVEGMWKIGKDALDDKPKTKRRRK